MISKPDRGGDTGRKECSVSNRGWYQVPVDESIAKD